MESFTEKKGGPTSRTRIKVDLQCLRLTPKSQRAVILEIIDTVGFVAEGIDDGVVCVPESTYAGYSKHGRGIRGYRRLGLNVGHVVGCAVVGVLQRGGNGVARRCTMTCQ